MAEHVRGCGAHSRVACLWFVREQQAHWVDWRLLGCVALSVAEAGRRGVDGGVVVAAGSLVAAVGFFFRELGGVPREGLQGLLGRVQQRLWSRSSRSWTSV